MSNGKRQLDALLSRGTSSDEDSPRDAAVDAAAGALSIDTSACLVLVSMASTTNDVSSAVNLCDFTLSVTSLETCAVSSAA